MEDGLREGLIVAQAQNFARALVNEPGNVLTPTELARRTEAMCAEVGLRCEVHSTDKLRELKMGAFLAVAQGSEQPPALITMTYEPTESPAADATRCWVSSVKESPLTPAGFQSSRQTAWRR